MGASHENKHDTIHRMPKIQTLDPFKPLPSLSDTVVDGLYGSDDGYEEKKYHNTRSSKHQPIEGKGIKTMKALRAAHRGPSQ